MDEKTPDQQGTEGQTEDQASSGLSAYLQAEREEEAWLEKMQAAAKAKKTQEKTQPDSDV